MLPYSQPPNLKEEVAEIVRLWDEPNQKRYTRKRLEALSPAAIEELVRLIHEEAAARKRFIRWILRFWLPGGILCWLCYFVFVVAVDIPAKRAIWLQGLPHLFNLTALGFMHWFSPRCKAGKVLAEQDDIQYLGPLIEALHFTDARESVTQALIRLLPQMKVSDAHLLDSEQKKALYKGLESTNKALVLAILKSLEQIGDGGALPYVEKLANPPKNKEVNEEVQEAAQVCLPFLTERAREENHRSTLLRASEPATQPDELLRPATTTTESDPAVLLRATQAE